MSAVAAVPNHEDLLGFDPGEVMLGYQRRWVADPAPLKIAEKSRRTGLTWAEAADAVLTAASSRGEGGTNHFYVGSNKEMAREFIDAAAMWAKVFDKAGSEISEEVFIDSGQDGKEILTFAIYFASGFKIQALSSNPSNLRGMQGNVTIDEAAFHDRLAEVLKAALALTMWGAKVRLISTHNGVENLFNELINDSRAGKKSYSVHRITLDDACAEGLYRRICQIRGKPWSQAAEDAWKAELLKSTATEDDALEEYYCVPKSGGGAYLSRALIEARMASVTDSGPVVRLAKKNDFGEWPESLRAAEVLKWCEDELKGVLDALDPNRPHCFGEDFARSGDLTVINVGEIAQDLHITAKLQVELKNIPFRQQEQILYYIVDALPRLRGGAMDARGNGQALAEYAQDKYGSEVIASVMLSESFYREQMPRFKAHFEDALITIPRDDDTRADLQALSVNRRGTPCLGEVRTGKEKERHGDAAISLFLMVYASTLDGAPIEFTPIPKSDHRNQLAGANRNNDDDIPQRGCW
ncbi:terminase family protein [Shewanella sp. 3B26]|uniref:Terminase family protein n=1 Tax=Shewanella zhuhaiensis TaxID=2919576 RepID=A0AAJ1BIU8_9GAMM|nr:terminase family protein [Shewanella zhuhaiensis]MCH4295583.1 terminase family protein [Shewanella zhuhaiensis]